MTWYSELHRGAQPRYLFLGVLIGVAPIVATRTESYVNGHGYTIGARHDTYFLGVLIGVAPDVATRTESHVNGHGSTIGARHDTFFTR